MGSGDGSGSSGNNPGSDTSPTDVDGDVNGSGKNIPDQEKTTKRGNNDNENPDPDRTTKGENTDDAANQDKTTKEDVDGDGNTSNTDNPTNDDNTDSGQVVAPGKNQGPDKAINGKIQPDPTKSTPKVPNQIPDINKAVNTDGIENPVAPASFPRRTCEFFCEDCRKRAGGTAYCGVCYKGSAGRSRKVSVPSCCRECEVMSMTSGKYQCKYCNKGS